MRTLADKVEEISTPFPPKKPQRIEKKEEEEN
jgi:hypothetical protein